MMTVLDRRTDAKEPIHIGAIFDAARYVRSRAPHEPLVAADGESRTRFHQRSKQLQQQGISIPQVLTILPRRESMKEGKPPRLTTRGGPTRRLETRVSLRRR